MQVILLNVLKTKGSALQNGNTTVKKNNANHNSKWIKLKQRAKLPTLYGAKSW